MAGQKAEAKSTNSNNVPLFKAKVTDLDMKLDNEIVYEFGGPLGCLGMMLGFPSLMYYFWICLEYHQGKMIGPAVWTVEGVKSFFWNDIWAALVDGARPTVYATKIYMGYILFSFILASTMPGPVVNGLPIPSLKGTRVSFAIIFACWGLCCKTCIGSLINLNHFV
jgi:delta24(24(1))-sterol reductase